MSGMFSISDIPDATMIAAGKMATAAFFAPLISTSPYNLAPPLIINFSIYSTFIFILHPVLLPKARAPSFWTPQRFWHSSLITIIPC